MPRRTSFLLVLLAVFPLRAEAQGEFVFGGIVIGYTALSVGAIRALHHGCCAAVQRGSEVDIVPASRTGAAEMRGQLVEVGSDSITVSVDSVAHRIATADIVRMRVKVRESQWAKGWAVGLLTGVGSGALVGFASGGDHHGGDYELNAPQAALVLGIVGGVVGSSVGALIGAALDTDRWRPADPLRMPFKTTLRPIVGKSVGLGVNVAF